MKPAPFDYAAPSSVEAACALLHEAGGGATLIAGGQTLMPLLNLRMSQPFILIDVNRIDGLAGVEDKGQGGMRIGPATRQADVLTHPLLIEKQPLLVRALGHVGHHQTRQRGTIGGSIALGEPAAEMPATAVALGARIEIRSHRGMRMVAAEELYLGPYMTVLEPDEMITAIEYPFWDPALIPLFGEVARRPGDFALTGLVGTLAVENGVVARASLCWFAMGPTPMKARGAEAALIGQPVSAVDADAVAALAVADTAPFDDHHASADYSVLSHAEASLKSVRPC